MCGAWGGVGGSLPPSLAPVFAGESIGAAGVHKAGLLASRLPGVHSKVLPGTLEPGGASGEDPQTGFRVVMALEKEGQELVFLPAGGVRPDAAGGRQRKQAVVE